MVRTVPDGVKKSLLDHKRKIKTKKKHVVEPHARQSPENKIANSPSDVVCTEGAGGKCSSANQTKKVLSNTEMRNKKTPKVTARTEPAAAYETGQQQQTLSVSFEV